MDNEKLKTVQDVISDFADMNLGDFRIAFQPLVSSSDPLIDRYLMDILLDFHGNRDLRTEVAAVLAEREDESFQEGFYAVIEKETETGLCKECIHGLIRIGTKEAIQKLNYLAKSKPNVTISTLLRKELEKLQQQEPVAYYLDRLALGNQNQRLCRNSGRVLIKIGDPASVDVILENFNKYDELARTEAARVASQVGTGKHLPELLMLLGQFFNDYHANQAFVGALDGYEERPKEERIAWLHKNLNRFANAEQEELLTTYLKLVSELKFEEAKQTQKALLAMPSKIGFKYLLESLIMIQQNQLANATKFHQETVKAARIRHARLKQVISELAYGIGKVAGMAKATGPLREQTVEWLIKLISQGEKDIIKMALYGAAFFVQASDEQLLNVIKESSQVEGMSRLLESLGQRSDPKLVNFFLDIAISHQIVEIQELATRPLRNMPQAHTRLRSMLEDESSERKKTAVRIIGAIGAKEFEQELLNLLDGQSDILRIEAIRALGHLGDEGVLNPINVVLYDARSPVLIETCLEGIADVGTPEAIRLLNDFSAKTRHKRAAMVAVKLIVRSFKTWRNPLPPEFEAQIFENFKGWSEDRQPEFRQEVYQFTSQVITWDLRVYEKLKTLFKEAASRLRLQVNWDKEEIALIEKSVRTLNRNFFYLKDLLEWHKELLYRCRHFDHDNSTTRQEVYEKVLKQLGKGNFVLGSEVEDQLEEVVLKGLELAGNSWRHQNALYQIAGHVERQSVRKELEARVSTVPIQAKTALMDALLKLGVSLRSLDEMTAIKKILVVEGSAFFRKRVVRHLEGLEYEVTGVESVEEAVASIETNRPDLIVAEVMLKTQSDGLEGLEQIHEKSGPFHYLISTNCRDVHIMGRVEKLKPLAILHKPYPLEKLEEAIQG